MFMDVPITVQQMYSIEEKGHSMGFLKKFMMENAGAAAVRRLVESGECAPIKSKKVLVLAGLGNNGGDGMVMARHLAGYGACVTLILLGTPEKIRTQEASWNWSLLKKMSSSVALVSLCDPQFARPVVTPDIIIDGMLGTGISGEIKEPYASAIRYVNDTQCYKLAVDVPSGMDPQTGDTTNLFTRCDLTVTFHRAKQGIPKRPDLTGTIHVEKIGIPPEAEEGIVL